MESVLHIASIDREVDGPLSIGHTQSIAYGDGHEEDDDPRGLSAATMRLGCPLGCPLEMIDHGATLTRVPLVKTIEFMPDPTRSGANVYLETVHYFKDQQHLIPIRTKIQSGPSQGLRITHLPSLTFARHDLSGDMRRPIGVRSQIIPGLMEHDAYFTSHKDHPVMDWIREDLTDLVSTSPVVDINFSAHEIGSVIHKYSQQVKATPYELNPNHLKDIVTAITLEREVIPYSFRSPDIIHKTVGDAQLRMFPHSQDFRCYGRIPVHKIPRVEKNPFGFEAVMDLIDRAPLTDFNLDIVVDTDCTILFYHENLAINRLSQFQDNDLGSFSSDSLLSELLDPISLKIILQSFLHFHPSVKEYAEEALMYHPVKLKLIKTLNDEALILIYQHNAKSGDEPLCGAYFDIALQSLAPLSILPQPNWI